MLRVNIPNVVVTYCVYCAGTSPEIKVPNGVAPMLNNTLITSFIIKKPNTEARAAVPLSCLARPTAVPTANNIGKFPNTILPTPCIIVNIIVITGILTKSINGWYIAGAFSSAAIFINDPPTPSNIPATGSAAIGSIIALPILCKY